MKKRKYLVKEKKEIYNKKWDQCLNHNPIINHRKELKSYHVFAYCQEDACFIVAERLKKSILDYNAELI
jgi:hypothetical protein